MRSSPISRKTSSLSWIVAACAIAALCSSPATGDPGVAQWQQLLPPDPNAAPARLGHTAIFDPVRNRMIVYGGDQPGPDLWEMTLGADVHWEPLTVTGPSPPAHSRHTAIYDPIRDRMIVFGGDGTPDVWALSLAEPMTWTRLMTLGNPPTPRTSHTAIYDARNDRMVVFGGYATLGPGYNADVSDLWALSLADPPTWTLLMNSGNSTAPNKRERHSAVYDPIRERMIVFGGEYQSTMFFDDTWEVSLDGDVTWARMDGSTPSPHARYGHTAVYDAMQDRIVIFGGTTDQSMSGSFGDVWAMPLSAPPAWELLSADAGPGPRWGHAAVFDSQDDRMLIYSGAGNYYVPDCWSMSLKDPLSWARLTPSEVQLLPSARSKASALYDPIGKRMIVFGGSASASAATDELWSLSLEGNPGWVRTSVPGGPDGTAPSYRAVLDPGRNRLVVVAERVDNSEALDEVWTLSLSEPFQWTRLALTEPIPSGRYGFYLAYDETFDEVLIWGGAAVVRLIRGGTEPDQGTKFRDIRFNEVWALSPNGTPQWRQLAPTQIPALSLYTYFDPKRHRLIGFDSSGARWELPLAADGAWTPHTAVSVLPPSGEAVYDPSRDRLIGFDWYLTNPWSMALDSDTPWEPMATSAGGPPSRYGAALVFDQGHDRLVAFGGGNAGTTATYLNDTWSLSFDTITATEVSLVRADATAERVSLTWYSANASQTASLYRRTEQEDWSKRAEIVAIDGTFTAEDRDIRPGARYAYRLQIGTYTSPTTWVDVPNAPRFEIIGVSPNPSHGALRVSYSLPTRGAVAFELFDLQGRCVMRREAENVDAGSHVTPWGADHALSPAVYMLRVTQGSNRRTSRVVVTE